jgi:hypothetical protein
VCRSPPCCIYVHHILYVQVPPAQPFPQGFDESYTLRGCSNPAHCGTFHRVAANCTSDRTWAAGGYCPGGAYEYSGSNDPTLCSGAPVYQQGGDDGPVLYFSQQQRGETSWWVGDSQVLEDCAGSVAYAFSAENEDPGGEPPSLQAYSTGTNARQGNGWVDGCEHRGCDCNSGCGIAAAAGGHWQQ